MKVNNPISHLYKEKEPRPRALIRVPPSIKFLDSGHLDIGHEPFESCAHEETANADNLMVGVDCDG